MRSPDATALRVIAYCGAAAFTLAVLAEHVLEPGLDPARNMVSEYANRPSGLVMTIGFGAWAASLAATALLVGGRTPLVSLWIAVGAVVLLAGFHTQTVAGRLPAGVRWHLDGRLHDIGSGVLTAALFAGAALTARRRPAIAALLVVALIVQVSLLVVGPSVGGVRQRCLLALALVWQIMILREHRSNL
jgi:hypothetical protein